MSATSVVRKKISDLMFLEFFETPANAY